MDPDANLIELRSLATATLSAIDNEADLDPDDVDRMASLVIALDEWLSRGGVLPILWAR